MRYLLDTNIFLWYIAGDMKLPDNHLKIIDDLENDIWLSVASLWEITIKVSKGTLDIDDDLENFFKINVLDAEIGVLQIEPSHLVYLHRLPFLHRAPFDRLIFAQSMIEKLAFLYTDKIFDEYRDISA
jgi:PIN domain nuclease of toxin-antitoxin system